jgi:nitrite reductase/ring-hydroxylating ferredoxin subunit
MPEDESETGDGGDVTRDDRRRVEVCPVEELPPGSRTVVEIEGREIGVFNVDGELYALRNVCPHQLAPLCEGQLTGEMTAPAVGEYELTRQGEILQCPWHGWQFDLKTGESVFNPHLKTSTYEVGVESTGGCPGRDRADADGRDEAARQRETYGTDLAGEEPPVDTYDVDVEREVVVLYV